MFKERKKYVNTTRSTANRDLATYGKTTVNNNIKCT